MKMRWTDDPVADAERYMAEQEEELKKLPVCDYCNEPIQDDYLFDLEGDIVCESCMNKHFRKHTEDYME
jgi:formylmethanofuran dehydrogenase subunit E